MKSLLVRILGAGLDFLWLKVNNLRALFLKRRIHHGKNFFLGHPNYLDFHGNFIVGDDVFINAHLTALIYDDIKIGSEVMFGPNVSLITSGHDPSLHGVEARNSRVLGPITIGFGAWIGAGTIILPNVEIGEKSVIGAGSVVTRNIPPNVIAAGNPCRVIREKTGSAS
jgi:acetyltransferase-like isoleucine patch superfamily enzyme